MPPYIKYSNLIKAVFFILFSLNITQTLAKNTSDKLYFLQDYDFVYTGKLKEVISPTTFVMDDNKEYKIAYIYVDIKNYKKVISQIETLLLNKELSLYKYKENKKDRYGRYRVIATFPSLNTNEVSYIQEEIILNGLGVLYIENGSENIINHLKKIDQSTPINALDTNKLSKNNNSYKIVEGKVIAFKETKKSMYLNFDKDWKSDFTIRINKNYWQNIKDSYSIDKIDDLVGKTIRIRGFIENYYGAMINLDHKLQMDIISE